jgi:hypothetical protein
MKEENCNENACPLSFLVVSPFVYGAIIAIDNTSLSYTQFYYCVSIFVSIRDHLDIDGHFFFPSFFLS